jgi:Cu/Ag efflux protein CusF
MKKLHSVFLIAAVAALSACATTAPENVSGTVSENLIAATATVKAIDLTTRKVTLQRADGSLVKVHADENVRNLAQVKVGDTVKVSYYESIAYEVKKPGESAPGTAVTEGLARAKPGEKPGGVAAQVVTITATIAAIDKSAMTVTLRGPDGEMTTVKARDPKKLDRVAVGDLVDITFTEALAISVETPK